MAAPELSIVAPGERTSGFDRASGTIRRALPNTYSAFRASELPQ